MSTPEEAMAQAEAERAMINADLIRNIGTRQPQAQAQPAESGERDKLAALLTSMRGLFEQQRTSAQQKSAVTAQATDEQLAAQQRTQETTAKFANAAGTSASGIMVQLAQDMNGYLTAARDARMRIEAKESASILANPVEWLSNQFSLKKDYDTYNRAAEGFNSTSAAVSSLTAATDQVARTNAGLEQKVTDATRAQAAKLQAIASEQEAQEIESNSIKAELEFSQAISQLDARQAAEVRQQLADARQAENDAWIKRNYGRQDAEYSRKVAKEDALERTKSTLLDTYNTGRKALGMPAASDWDTVQAQAELGGSMQAEFARAMEAGQQVLLSGGKRAFKDTGSAATAIAAQQVPAAKDPQFARMNEYLTKLNQRAKANFLGQAVKPEQLAESTNALMQADLERYKYDNAAKGSPYAPPPLPAVVSTRSVQATALYKKVIAPLAADLAKEDSSQLPTKLLDMAFEAAEQRVLTWEQAAAGIAEYFGQAVNINNLANRYESVGMPAQEKYIAIPDLIGFNEPVDMSNYASVLRALTINRIRKYGKVNPAVNPDYKGFDAILNQGKVTKEGKK